MKIQESIKVTSHEYLMGRGASQEEKNALQKKTILESLLGTYCSTISVCLNASRFNESEMIDKAETERHYPH